LYGIIYHHGNSERGHYNCAVKVNGRWFSVDDDVINLINGINCTNSYILFYKKIIFT
jgi:ubiquitin C-terminal hydrolase